MTTVLPLSPVLLDKVWGGDQLAHFGLRVAAGSRVGEAWLVADMGSTSHSGAGGGAVRSPVRGEAPRTLGDVVRKAAHQWIGAAVPQADGGFPLLVKLLDAREHLSVQVHPSPRVASASARVKHECWYVLEAAPNSRLFLGLRDGCDRAGLAAAIRDDRVPEVLRGVPAVVGECHFLPSGLVHALGAGVVVAEVQTPSDTTYRVYDWTREYGRKPREMHVAAALEACDPALQAVTRRADAATRTLLAQTAAFELFHQPLTSDPITLEIGAHGRPLVLVPLQTELMVRIDGHLCMVMPGESAVVAAGRRGAVTVQTRAPRGSLLVTDVFGELA